MGACSPNLPMMASTSCSDSRGVLSFSPTLLVAPCLALSSADQGSTEVPVQIVIGVTAVCALTDAGEFDCWSDFRYGDSRHNVPDRFRAP